MDIALFNLLRVVAVIPVFYLLLHIVVARYSRRPDSKLLWFFEVLTAPLTRLAARFAGPGARPDRLRWLALAGCMVLWAVIRILDRIVVGR